MTSHAIRLFLVICLVSICCTPALSQQPVIVTAQPTMFEGTVQGMVLVEGKNASVPGASVRLVNATREATVYGTVSADGRGHYYFVNVAPMGSGSYRVKAWKGNDSGMTRAFGVSSLENKMVDVYVHARPAGVTVHASGKFLVTNGKDQIGVTATVKDAYGLTVHAGYPVTFRVGGSLPGRHPLIMHSVTDDEGRATIEVGPVGVGRGETGGPIDVTAFADEAPSVAGSIAIAIRDADVRPPETTIQISGTPDNAGGYTSNVLCTLTAADSGGWGANATYYRIGDGVWSRYTGPFEISGDGATTVYYYSNDLAGNVEKTKSRTIVINKKMSG